MSVQSFFLIILAALNSCLGNLALKYSRTVALPGAHFFSKMLNGYFVLGMVFYFINVTLFAKALDGTAVSVAYPVLAGSGFAMLAIASAITFGERFGPQQLTGLLVVVIGIILLARVN